MGTIPTLTAMVVRWYGEMDKQMTEASEEVETCNFLSEEDYGLKEKTVQA